MANHGEGSAARSVPYLRLCAGGTPGEAPASRKDDGFQRGIACRAELAKTFAHGSGKTDGGADALLWGIETPHEWLVLARTAPHSLTLWSGSPWRMSRATRLKATGPFRDGFELPDHQESERIVCGGAPQTKPLRQGEWPCECRSNSIPMWTT